MRLSNMGRLPVKLDLGMCKVLRVSRSVRFCSRQIFDCTLRLKDLLAKKQKLQSRGDKRQEDRNNTKKNELNGLKERERETVCKPLAIGECVKINCLCDLRALSVFGVN